MLRNLVAGCVFVMAIAITACGGGSVAVSSPSPLTGGLTGGLMGYVADQGGGALDPATGKSTIGAPMPDARDPPPGPQVSQSEGPRGLVPNSHFVALTVGCCASYEVDALDLTQPLGPLKVLAKPPTQAAFFTEGAAPGLSGLLAGRGFGPGGG